MILIYVHAILAIMEARGLYLTFSEGKWKIFVYYTQISNAVSLISSLLLLVLGQNAFVSSVRYLACCMLVFTFFVCLLVLWPMGANPKMLFLEGHSIYHHLLCPVLSTLSYIFLEEHAGKFMVPVSVAVTLCYGFTMIYLNAVRKVDGPYPFFRVHDQSKLATVLWMIVLALAAGVLFTLIRLAAE